jgi:hypothetical protein
VEITRKTELWLQQFRREDLDDAERLLRAFRFIDEESFRDDLSHLIKMSLPENEVTALFIEREEPKTTKRMYKEKPTSRGRGKPPRLSAVGVALPVIRPVQRVDQDVGSEAIVAHIASQLAREQSKRFLIQPSAEAIRDTPVRHLAVVTDVIGSGTRVDRFLSLLWRVRSVRSWKSYKKIRLWVFAYSATDAGRAVVESHPSGPQLEIVSACPTLGSAFRLADSIRMAALCRNYSPDRKEPLGYRDAGTLMAFAHTCPNTTPAIFHKDSQAKRRPWQALFAHRVTRDRSIGIADADPVGLALDTLGFGAIRESPAYENSDPRQREVIALLCAIRKGHRHLQTLTAVTGMRLAALSDAEALARSQGLIGGNRRLSEPGFALLRKLKRTSSRRRRPVVPEAKESRYYPRSLRAPR